MDVLRQAFSLTPEYLKTSESDAGVRKLMDTGMVAFIRKGSRLLWKLRVWECTAPQA